MGAIPDANLSGYTKLRDRANTALSMCKETQAVDFKESQPWSVLKWKIIKTAMGMGNLRDGGIIIIGVSERNDDWKLTGISPEHLRTYNVDNMTDQINKYASPVIDIDVVKLKHDGDLLFLVIHVAEFVDSPIVCKRDAPTDAKISQGIVYIRPPGKAETRKVMKAEEMHDLLEIASEKRAMTFYSKEKRLGLTPAIALSDKNTKAKDVSSTKLEESLDKFKTERDGL